MMLRSTMTMFVHRLHQKRLSHANLGMQEPPRECVRKKWSLQQSPEQENLLPINAAVDRGPRDRVVQELLGNWKKWVELLEHATLGHRTNDFCLDLTLVEQQHGGDAHDIEATSDVAVVINIEFGNDDLARLLGSNLLEDRRDLLAWSAPFGPKVNKDWCF